MDMGSIFYGSKTRFERILGYLLVDFGISDWILDRFLKVLGSIGPETVSPSLPDMR